MNIQEYLYTILEEPEKNKIAYWINVSLYVLIIISIVSLMLSSVKEYHLEYKVLFTNINNTIMSIFILEYILRVYASGKLITYNGLKGKLKYAMTPYAIVDLLTILPFIIIGFGMDSAFIRSLRLLRVFRLFRIKKYASFIQKIQKIVISQKEEFSVLLFFTLLILILLSFIIFEVEHDAQPEIFTNIFQTFWWAVATLTTVGYGDMYPITTMGKLITAIISILGIAFIAIPGGIFASEFMNSISKKEDVMDNNICPKCSASSIKSLPNPTISVNHENLKFNEFKECPSCKFSWLE